MSLKAEPVAIVAVVESLIALAIGFGANVSPEQMALILAAVTSVLALVVRQKVTPV